MYTLSTLLQGRYPRRSNHCCIDSTNPATAKTLKPLSTGAKKQVQENEAKIEWAPEQLTEYRRMRLDQYKTASIDFSFYVQLTTRLSIYELFVNDAEQRGRFVKSIVVYCSPRPVNDVTQLKDEYVLRCSFPEGDVGGNLKCEYVIFTKRSRFSVVHFRTWFR